MSHESNPEFNPEQFREDKRKFLLETRDSYRSGANELQRDVAEVQSAKYESALMSLMIRTGDNPEVINAMNQFLDALKWRAQLGMRGEEFGSPMGKRSVDDLLNVLQEARDRLNTRPS